MAWFQKRKQSASLSSEEEADRKTSYEDGYTDSPSRSLPSREDGFRQLQQTLDRQGNQSKGMILKLYIENFRQLNETFGYDYCEALLDQIISYLEQVSHNTVYRYIGVEFFIILKDYSTGQATVLAEKILDQFGHVWKVSGTDCLCSVQIGMCPYPGYTFSASEMMKFLDMALSEAAESGPNQYAVYDSEMQASFSRKQAIARYLQTALDNDEIDVTFWPAYNIQEEKFTMAKYYMKIFIKGIGMVGAGEFLPIAEDSGQIRSVEYYALNRIGQCIRRLLDEGKEFDFISLPISSVLFLQEDFLDKIQEIIDMYDIPRGKLAIELKDSVFTTAYLNISVLLQELSQMGVELVLCSYGSGMASLSAILDLPVSSLKLDRMFLWQMENDPRAEIVITDLVDIAKKLSLHVIAEGVETEKQVSALSKAGCIYQAGFYYSSTVKEHTLIRLIGENRETGLRLCAEEQHQA